MSTFWTKAGIAMVAVAFGLLLTVSSHQSVAKTPDGETPSVEDVCSGFTGAEYGLCNAYCEAQDCDVHDRPSCDQLRDNFEKKTGSPIFPCDVALPECGNGTVEPTEDCDPPESVCDADGRICDDDCLCPAPECGDGIIDVADGEECDPPMSACGNGGTCSGTCECVLPPPTVCCQCGNADTGTQFCLDATSCPTDCRPTANATCDATGFCVPIP